MSHNKKILVGSLIFDKLLVTSGRSPLAEICTKYGNEFILELANNAPELFESRAFLEAVLFNQKITSSLPSFPFLKIIRNALHPSSNKPIPSHFFDIHGFSLVENLIGYKETEHIFKKMVSGESDVSVIDYFISKKSQHFIDDLLIHFRNPKIHTPTFILQTTTIGVTSGKSLLSTVLSSNEKKIEELYDILLTKKSLLGPAEYESILIALASINSAILKMNPEYGRKLLSFLLFGIPQKQSNPSFNSAISAASLLMPELLKDKEGLVRLKLLSATQSDADFWGALVPCVSEELGKPSTSVEALTTIFKNKKINSAVLMSMYSNGVSTELTDTISCALTELKTSDFEAFSLLLKNIDKSEDSKLQVLLSQYEEVKLSVIDASIFKPTGKEDEGNNKASSFKKSNITSIR